ncbi:hypothetical protein V1525DRAFT_17804 [Lipomyces kononenkoae]|uniref:Uncharacterized protein n=1 Tax=Lipomyces kononenkoae TaxID=34357 RepID=A0ACC3T7T1_LIPKO
MPKKKHPSNVKGDQRKTADAKSNGKRSGNRQGGRHRFGKADEGRGYRRSFSMRDEALSTLRRHSLNGEDTNSPTSRSAVTFVKSAGLSDNNNKTESRKERRQLEYTQSEESAEELYNELLDEEDELVENTRHLSIVHPDDRDKLDSHAESEGRYQAASDVDDMANVPDDLLFMTDEVSHDVDLSFNDEIVFAPRHIRLSASGVRLPPRSLDLTAVSKIVDEPVYGHVADTTGGTTSATATTSKAKKKKSKAKRAKAPTAMFPYKVLVSDDEEDPLDDYIQNLYDDGIFDESLEKVNSAGSFVEEQMKLNYTSSGDDNGIGQKVNCVNAEIVNRANESSSEYRETVIGTVDNDHEEERDGDGGDIDDGDDDNTDYEDGGETDGDEEEEDFDIDEDNFDYGDDDDVLESERRFAEATLTNFSPRNQEKQMPEFDISDEDLQSHLRSEWLKDKDAKKKRKQERERLRREGLLGKKAKKGKPDLKAKYSRGMQVSDIKREIELFLRNDGQTCLSLPPMAKNSRKTVHVLASAYNLSSKSIGGGTQRFTVLFKNSSSHMQADFGTLSIVEDRFYLPRLDKKSSKRAVTKDFSKRGTGSFKHRDGDVVGSNAPEIDIDNKGRQLLERMGWISGSGLGVAGNVGPATPILARVKTSKAGLG